MICFAYRGGNKMVLKTKNVTKTYDMEVFTDDGLYFGNIEEVMLSSSKVHGWRIKATKNSYLTKVLGGAKGVIVPHNLVRAVGDVFIISKNEIPSYEEESQQGQESMEA